MLSDRVLHENDPGPRCDRLQGSMIEVDMNIRAMKKKAPGCLFGIHGMKCY